MTGLILTKLDGDSRGGAALSVRHVTGRPIKFVGVGEKLDGLELFSPDRMASRILGMGDIVALVEDVKKSVDQKSAQDFAKRMQSGERFDLNDFKAQIAQMRQMGGLSSLIDKLPAQLAEAAGQINPNDSEKQIRRTEGIINSMTAAERAKPDLIKASRKRRIAAGAGVPVQEINRMLKQFDQMQAMMKQMKKGGLAKMMRGLAHSKHAAHATLNACVNPRAPRGSARHLPWARNSIVFHAARIESDRPRVHGSVVPAKRHEQIAAFNVNVMAEDHGP